MNFRKTIAGITATLLAAGSFAALPMSAFAADTVETTEQYFTEGKIKEYIYAADKTADVECRFYAKTPNIPYISLSEYYKALNNGESLSIDKNEDGTYKLENIIGITGIIDTEKDTLTTNSYEGLVYPLEEANSESDLNKVFIETTGTEILGEPHAITIDFSNYNIDLYGEDSDIWFPVSTLCNTFSGSGYRGIYYNNSIFFTNETTTEFTSQNVFTSESMAEIAASMSNGRPEDLAVYNYNEICRLIDCNYGFPGRIPINDILIEKGLDRTLSETNDDTKLVKEHLLSTDYNTYLTGLLELEQYMWDGGHTVMASAGVVLLSEDQIQGVIANLKEDRNYELASDMSGMQYGSMSAYQGAKAARSAVLGETEETPFRYVINGDTALFSFDDFMSIDFEGWNNYYTGKGERPEDLVSVFYECVKDADENPDVKNFVVDVSTNGGGYVMVGLYMIGLMGGESNSYYNLLNYGATAKENYIVDKNLDGKFDEIDNNLKFDLNFGVIASKYSFSSANTLPSNARDAGLVIIGEQSGGGSCTVFSYTTPDGIPLYMSNTVRAANKNNENIDAGIKPDYEVVTINEDGSKDFSKVFDFDVLSKCFAEFYAKNNTETPDPVVTTTSSAATTTSTTTTTTTATTTTTTASTSETTSSTSDNVSSTTSSTTTQNSETTTAATTTTSSSELPETGNNSLTTVAVTFTAIALTAGGALALTAGRKKDEE